MECSPIVRFTSLVPPAIARAGTVQRAVPTDNIGMHRFAIEANSCFNGRDVAL